MNDLSRVPDRLESSGDITGVEDPFRLGVSVATCPSDEYLNGHL